MLYEFDGQQPVVGEAGNPARVIRDIAPKDQELWNWAKDLYIDLAKRYLDVGMRPIDGGRE